MTFGQLILNGITDQQLTQILAIMATHEPNLHWKSQAIRLGGQIQPPPFPPPFPPPNLVQTPSRLTDGVRRVGRRTSLGRLSRLFSLPRNRSIRERGRLRQRHPDLEQSGRRAGKQGDPKRSLRTGGGRPRA